MTLILPKHYSRPLGAAGGLATISIPSGTTAATSTSSATVSGTLDLGAAAAGRQILVANVSGQNTGTLRTVSSVSIGAVSASLIAGFTHATYRRIELWGAAVPTGTSATVTATWSGSSAALGMCIFSGENMDLSAAHDTATDASETSPHAGTLDIPAGGVGIGIMNLPSGGSGSTTWGGIDAVEEAQFAYQTGARFMAAVAEAFSTVQSGLSVSGAWTNASSFSEGTLWVSLGSA